MLVNFIIRKRTKNCIKKRLRVGAECTVASKFLHSRKLVNEKVPNATAQTKVDKLIITWCDGTEVQKKVQKVIYFRHELFDGTEVYCVPRWVTVNTEGGGAGLFDQEENTEMAINANSVDNGVEVPPEVM